MYNIKNKYNIGGRIVNFETMHKYFRCPAPEDIPTEVFVQVEYKKSS